MILIADSGSTKTDWILKINHSEFLEFSTRGINPYFLNEKEISKILAEQIQIQEYSSRIQEVHFFGEGCSTPDKREIVSNGLSKIFSKAYVSVESDALGSAYATCGNTKGFVCILGTSSNIAFYNGHEVQDSVHGLGFILEDDGSGTYFGRKLITSYLYETMPADLRKAFGDQYPINKDIIIENVYQKPLPSFYIASFAKFLSQQRSHPFVEDLLIEGFDSVIRSYLLPYHTHQSYPCHFVGSIAYHFQDVLLSVCAKYNIQTGKILSNPIQELTAFVTRKVDVS